MTEKYRATIKDIIINPYDILPTIYLQLTFKNIEPRVLKLSDHHTKIITRAFSNKLSKWYNKKLIYERDPKRRQAVRLIPLYC